MKLKEDVLPLLQETWTEFSEDDAAQLGASLSYYAMFSIFPLLLLLLAVLGFVLRGGDTEQEILNTVGQSISPDFAKTLSEILAEVKKSAGAATGVGLVTLLLGASGVFRQLEVSFNRIWNVPQAAAQSYFATAKSMVIQWFTSFGMVLALGFLLLISLALTGITSTLLGALGDVPVVGGYVGYIGGYIITLLINTLIFALMFKYLPRTSVAWRDVWLGAALTALIWELAKRGLALYIGSSSYASAYGIVGGVLILMTWIYFSSQVLFLGAEFTQVYARRHGSRQMAPAAPGFKETFPPPLPAQLAPGSDTSAKVGAATGAGLVIGAAAGVLAAGATLIIGARRAVAFRGRKS